MPESDRDSDVLAHAARLLEMVNSSWMPRALRTAAELGIAALLAHGPRFAADLAEATSAHEPSLHSVAARARHDRRGGRT